MPHRGRSMPRLVVALCAALGLASATHDVAAATAPGPREDAALAVPIPGDAAVRAAVLSQVWAFYRDLAARDWSGLAGRFWPAKVTTRWEPPADDDTWVLTPVDGAPADLAGIDVSAVAIGIRGRWARVEVTCGSSTDAFRLFEMEGQWRISRLALGTRREGSP